MSFSSNIIESLADYYLLRHIKVYFIFIHTKIILIMLIFIICDSNKADITANLYLEYVFLAKSFELRSVTIIFDFVFSCILKFGSIAEGKVFCRTLADMWSALITLSRLVIFRTLSLTPHGQLIVLIIIINYFILSVTVQSFINISFLFSLPVSIPLTIPLRVSNACFISSILNKHAYIYFINYLEIRI